MPNIHTKTLVLNIPKGKLMVYQNEMKNKIEIKEKLGHFKVWED